MKKVTAKEFSEIAKNDEKLMEKLKTISEIESDDLPSKITEIIKESGYELENDPSKDVEELSDEELALAVGGVEAVIDRSEICAWIYKALSFLLSDEFYENCFK